MQNLGRIRRWQGEAIHAGVLPIPITRPIDLAADVTARGQGGTWRAALRPSGATDADVRAAGRSRPAAPPTGTELNTAVAAATNRRRGRGLRSRQAMRAKS